MALIPNLPTPEGRAFGTELARLTGPVPHACEGCAFVAGTDANGSPVTTATAFLCVLENDQFNCHMRPGACAGWAKAREGLKESLRSSSGDGKHG